MAMDREERIRQLAHDIWEREGHPHGRDAEHWRMATEAYEAEVTRARLDDAGEPIEEELGATWEPSMGTPAVASSDGAVANQPAASQPVATRKRRTKAEMEAARAAETAAPARRRQKSQTETAPPSSEPEPTTKRKRRTAAEIAAAAAGVVGTAAAVAATVAATKRRRGTKADAAGEAAPDPAANVALRRPRTARSGATLTEVEPADAGMAGNVASGAVPDPSADRSTDETISAVPDPGAELPSDTAPETFSEGVPETGPSAERVEE
jgi:hypothetical protein